MSKTGAFRKELAENLNPIKKGRKKTNRMVEGYCMTMIVFLFLTILSISWKWDPNHEIASYLIKNSMLLCLWLSEALFGIYSFLSLRVRRLEEIQEIKELQNRR